MGIFNKVVNAVAPRCSLCRARLLKNHKKSLLENFKKSNYSDTKVNNVKYICADCEKKLERKRCNRCKSSFPLIKKRNYYFSNEYGLSSIKGSYFCKNCLIELNKLNSEFKETLDNWVDGTKLDYIKDFNIVKTLGLVEYDYCRNPNELEEVLKNHTVQLGGNGFIKFFWNKEIEKSSEKVIAGYSKNNNPYYKTEYSTKTYFIGSAMAVLVEPKNKKDINIDIDNASYKYVIECSQALEKYIENNLSGQGKGLHEKITSIEDELSAKDLKSFRFIATARNNIIHEGKIIGDIEKFKNTCEQLKLKYN